MQPDVSFDSVETLQPVPRLLYGLLRSPVLTQAPGHHPDLHTALRLLWTALPPEELRRAVYPLLSSYTTPDVQACPLPTECMRASWQTGARALVSCSSISLHEGAVCFVRDSRDPIADVFYVSCAAGIPATLVERSSAGNQRGTDLLAGQLHAGQIYTMFTAPTSNAMPDLLAWMLKPASEIDVRQVQRR